VFDFSSLLLKQPPTSPSFFSKSPHAAVSWDGEGCTVGRVQHHTAAAAAATWYLFNVMISNESLKFFSRSYNLISFLFAYPMRLVKSRGSYRMKCYSKGSWRWKVYQICSTIVLADTLFSISVYTAAIFLTPNIKQLEKLIAFGALALYQYYAMFKVVQLRTGNAIPRLFNSYLELNA